MFSPWQCRIFHAAPERSIVSRDCGSVAPVLMFTIGGAVSPAGWTVHDGREEIRRETLSNRVEVESDGGEGEEERGEEENG